MRWMNKMNKIIQISKLIHKLIQKYKMTDKNENSEVEHGTKVQNLTVISMFCVILTLLISTGFIIVTTEKISRDLVPICKKGYCLTIQIKTKSFSSSNNIPIDYLIQNVKDISKIGIQTLLVENLYEYIHSQHFDSSEFETFVYTMKKNGIGLFSNLGTTNLEKVQKLIDNGVHGFVVNSLLIWCEFLIFVENLVSNNAAFEKLFMKIESITKPVKGQLIANLATSTVTEITQLKSTLKKLTHGVIANYPSVSSIPTDLFTNIPVLLKSSLFKFQLL